MTGRYFMHCNFINWATHSSNTVVNPTSPCHFQRLHTFSIHSKIALDCLLQSLQLSQLFKHQWFVHRACKIAQCILKWQFQAMTETPYDKYPTVFCLDLCCETRAFAAIHGSSSVRKIDQFIPEFAQIMFREAPLNNSIQHPRGSLIKCVHLDHFKVRQIWFVCFMVDGITYKTFCSFTTLSAVPSMMMAIELPLSNFSRMSISKI